jgi:protein-L-isoaspartate(D-aspartate) O-methyltransferase
LFFVVVIRKSALFLYVSSILSESTEEDYPLDRLADHRIFYAHLIASSAGVTQGRDRIVEAFATVPRELFLGPGPWTAFTGAGLVETPSDNPAFLYQDIVVSIAPERKINNGQPSLHAAGLAALDLKKGDSVVQVGAGTGYYSAIMSRLVGETGSVVAYEIEQDLAHKAATYLSMFQNVSVINRSGSEGDLPRCDAIYVCAGSTAPLDLWLNALHPSGRLVFPLTPAESLDGMPGGGGMLLAVQVADDYYRARFVSPATFIPCIGARDEETAAKLTVAFSRGGARNVRSLRRGTPPDETCWCSGKGWWLSTSEIA